jgi:hypothetical protein
MQHRLLDHRQWTAASMCTATAAMYYLYIRFMVIAYSLFLCLDQNQQQQQNQWGGGGGAAAPPPAIPAAAAPPAAQFCFRCRGVHLPKGAEPCFVQPREYPKQVQWAPPLAVPEVDEDEDDASEAEEAADPPAADDGQQQQQPRVKRRQPIRFIFWDVETEQLADEEEEEQQIQIVGPQAQQQQQQQIPLQEAGPAGAAAQPMVVRQLRHRPVLVCAEVLCERCIVYGVDLEAEPKRKAPGCFCGVPWRLGSAIRQRWCQLADVQKVAAGQMPADGRNPRMLAFHQFHGEEQEQMSPMAQFVDYLLHHGTSERVRTIGLAHNGVCPL